MIRTGDAYRESIRAHRGIHVGGERVQNVTTHPIFKPVVDIRADVYDMQHDPATRDIMTHTRDGETSAIGSKLPYSQKDWWAKRRATDAVLDRIGGVVARTGDETVAEMWSRHDAREMLNGIDPRFATNIDRHIARAVHADAFHVSANTDPKGDRAGLPQDRDPDILLAFARDLLNSDYAGHRLSLQLFGQAPPFTHLAPVYRNFDWDGPLAFVREAAGLSDRVMGPRAMATADSGISRWFSMQPAGSARGRRRRQAPTGRCAMIGQRHDRNARKDPDMSIEEVDTLVVGGGQAGVAMSEHLGNASVPHLVLERHRIAERWRSERWDSLVANGPARHDRFPGMEFDDTDAEAFAPKESVADYFVAYANRIGAPIRCGVAVREVRKANGRPGFRVTTSEGVIHAARVVAATGPFQKPVIPPVVPGDAGPAQIHSSAYRNPAQLAEGAVLVVGAGSSGVQIAEELMRAGRRVYLSVGRTTNRRGATAGAISSGGWVFWVKWDAAAQDPDTEHVTISVSGARGGHTVAFRRLAEQGMTLVGRTEAYDDGTLRFASDLADNLARGDDTYLSLLGEADA
nr:4-hydroxyphenylacetate 3-hydroxylase N-terminal domain-containing protein [Roseovarius salinarum]